MPLKIRPLSDALGAEVIGLKLESDVTEAVFREIVTAWRDHQVLLFRDQKVEDGALLDFARRFGVLDPAPYIDAKVAHPPEFPEISVVSNVLVNGEPIGSLSNYELAWHSDMTFQDHAPVGCILHAWEVPLDEGATLFTSLRAALETLPVTLRERIRTLRAFHDKSTTSAGTLRHGIEGRAGVLHPLLISHPSWGEEILLLGRRANSFIDGMDHAEGLALLDEIWAHATRPEFAISHQWRPGDVVIWDNLLTMHRRDGFSSSARRILHRAQIRSLYLDYRTNAPAFAPISDNHSSIRSR